MRGLKKYCMGRGQTDRHQHRQTDIATTRKNRPKGRVFENGRTVMVTWSQMYGKMAYIICKITFEKIFLKFGLQGSIFWPLHNLWSHLHMFLDILELRVENKNESFWKLLWKFGLRNPLGVIVLSPESTKDCWRFHVFCFLFSVLLFVLCLYFFVQYLVTNMRQHYQNNAI